MMRNTKAFVLIAVLISTIASVFVVAQKRKVIDNGFVSYIADPKKQDVAFYFKDDKGVNFQSIQNLNRWLLQRNKTLVFATNGGMYNEEHAPKGLFIEKQKTIVALDTASGVGNFYLKPNGVFYITNKGIPFICNTKDFHYNANINFATQSGPMLLINGNIHPAFKQASTNVNTRNGVGITADNKIVFVMSKSAINFYYFADYFKKSGCKNALYLDGFVSRTYLPEQQWTQTDGKFWCYYWHNKAG